MQIVQLEAENFKILRAVRIEPNGNVITIGGENGQGKSSVMDAIWVALKGRSVAPPVPIRKGEEKCRIRLDLGELVVTRTFNLQESGQFTDSVKIESADGRQRFTRPQEMLDELMGAIGFDPFEFAQMSADEKAAELLQLVPLPVDLDELAEADARDYQSRRDITRDANALEAQINGIGEITDVPDDVPDRAAIMDQMTRAADIAQAVAEERIRRDRLRDEQAAAEGWARKRRQDAENHRRALELAEAEAKESDEKAARINADLDALPELETPPDVTALRQQLADADAIAGKIEAKQRRDKLVSAHEKLRAEANALTAALAKRERERQDALAKAKMPIDGLGFAINEKGKPVVTLNGLPFENEQVSTADQIRASTAIAMAANPELRVLRIRDGSLLDDKSRAILAEMAEAEDFQIWMEVVGTGGVGIVIQNGEILGADAPEPEKPKGKSKAKSDKPEGAML